MQTKKQSIAVPAIIIGSIAAILGYFFSPILTTPILQSLYAPGFPVSRTFIIALTAVRMLLAMVIAELVYTKAIAKSKLSIGAVLISSMLCAIESAISTRCLYIGSAII